GNLLTGCGQYQIDATLASSDPTYINITYLGEPLYYKPWTVVSVDLSAYIGQSITIEFQTADCTQTGHFGYAYIDGSCGIIQGYVNGYCTGSTQVLLTAPTGFVGYVWSGPNSLTPIPGATDDSLIITNPNLNDTFFVQMVNAAGCTTVVMTIITPSSLDVQSITSSPTCLGGSSGSANVVPTGGLVSGYNFIWSTAVGGTGTVLGTSQSVTGLPNDTVWVNITSGNCPPKDTFIVVAAAPPPLQLQNQPFCNSTSPQVLVAPAGTNFQWYNNTQTLLAGETNDSLIAATPVNGQSYTVSYDSPLGCRDSVKITFVLTAGGNPGIQNVTAGLCPGVSTGSAQVQVTGITTGPYNYNVNGPAGSNTGTSATVPFSLSNLTSGTYTVTVTDANCIYTQVFTIPTYTLNAAISQQNNPCYLDSVGTIQVVASGVPGVSSININGPAGFNSATTGTIVSLTDLNSGMYVISMSNSGCNFSDTVIIIEPPMPNDTLVINTTFCDGDTSAVLGAPLGFTNYQWYYGGVEIPGATNDSIFILNPGATYSNYSVTYIVAPCERKTIIIFRSIPGTLFTPDLTTNIFTPNGDNKNDLFHPYFNPLVTQKYIEYAEDGFNIKIYDRWGILMYESDNYIQAWNGKNMHGKECGDGTYFWMATYKSRCGNGEFTSQKGYVQLLR
ncbi:MAG: gliding motility-associated C-terminal domain-containing protein, partial [Bacteroidia bacterium]|nr:gliding motility-associated C-terminal domain-containing protein [Bacteroidia bacterium]